MEVLGVKTDELHPNALADKFSVKKVKDPPPSAGRCCYSNFESFTGPVLLPRSVPDRLVMSSSMHFSSKSLGPALGNLGDVYRASAQRRTLEG